MTVEAAGTARRSADRGRVLELVGLVLLAYVPFLLSSRGELSSDTKQYLYLDPGAFLERAPFMWDPQVGMGTVPHQHLGYLFPMGPYFWLMDLVGAPDWVAQRLWLGTISLGAVLGARWLFRMLGVGRIGALAGALVYMLTPYQLAFTARISVLLLAWAGLPWLVGLTARAARRGGWADPAWFALVVLTIGGVNASSLLLVGVAPVVWLALELFCGRDAARAAIGAALRIGVLTIATSLWWIVGLRLQGRYGLPVLQLTETLRTAAEWSNPTDLLRGIGNWFFYGFDQLGFSINQTRYYVFNRGVVVATFAIPVVALVAAAIVRWRHRAYFALLVVVGTIIGVGAWPYDDPSVYGRVFKAFANNTSAGLALRNTARVAPVIVLGLAGLLAAGVGALATVTATRMRWKAPPWPSPELAGGVLVGLLAFAALAPVWSVGFLSTGVSRPEDVPAYWDEAAAALDREGNDTRVLEIPGADFAAYRWGNAIEPVTPGLTDRPFVAREVLPYGEPGSVNLLVALDNRIQEGTFEPSTLAAYARLINVGTVVLRSDLATERFDTPRPRMLWQLLTDPLAPSVRAPQGFGEPVPNPPPPELPILDELELRTPESAADPPPVALFPVEDPVPIVHAAPSDQPVVLSGDGDGIVDAIGAGLLDGRQLVFELATLDAPELARELRAGADLVLTDTNRKRSERWFSRVRDNTGATERADETRGDREDGDFRLDVAPGAGNATRTVVEQHGGRVDATDSLGPADRPARAFDHDLRTAWRFGGDVDEQRLVLRPRDPVTVDHVTLVQPQTIEHRRWITRAELRIDDGEPITVDLGPESRTPAGQVVAFPEQRVREIEIEPLATNLPAGDFDPATRDGSPENPVGFAEVLLDDVQVRETVRLPVDAARRVGEAANGHRLDVVLTRLRYEPGRRDRHDEELALDRRFVLPDDRQFGVEGTARIDPNAPDALLDTLLGTTAPGTTFSASGHLAGDLDARASRAFDGDPATAWIPPFGASDDQFVEVALPAPVTVDHVDLAVVADGRRPVPTRLRIEGGGALRSVAVPEVADVATRNATQTVTIPFDPLTAPNLRVVIDAVRPGTTGGAITGSPPLPVAIAEVGLAGVPRPATATVIAVPCRSDLLEVNGAPVAVQVSGPAADARSGLALDACDASVALDRGSNTLRTAPGLDTGIDIDRVVLSSGDDGSAASVTTLGAPLDSSGAEVKVDDRGSGSYELEVETDGRPFWLVLGESYSDGWDADASGKACSPSGCVSSSPQLVNGFANGWLITPSGPGVMQVSLEWTPQKLVWVALALSAFAVAVCVVLVVVGRRRPPPDVADAPSITSPLAYAGARPSARALAFLAIGAGVGAALVSRWWIGVIVAVATVVATRVGSGRILLTAGAPLAVVLSRALDLPELGWLTITLLAADVLLARAWAHGAPGEAPHPAGSDQGQDAMPRPIR